MIQPFDEEEWIRISKFLHSATFGTTFLTVRLGICAQIMRKILYCLVTEKGLRYRHISTMVCNGLKLEIVFAFS